MHITISGSKPIAKQIRCEICVLRRSIRDCRAAVFIKSTSGNSEKPLVLASSIATFKLIDGVSSLENKFIVYLTSLLLEPIVDTNKNNCTITYRIKLSEQIKLPLVSSFKV